MKMFWFLLTLFAFGLFQDKGSVNVYRIETETGIEIYAKNSNLYPVTLEYMVEYENLKPNKGLPLVRSLQPNTDQKIMVLEYSNLAAGWDYSSQYRYYMGDFNVRHNDSFAYRLPFPIGEEYLLSQGFNGSFSHQGELPHALDFAMPEGTPLYAARHGKVVMMEERNTKGGPTAEFMEYANFITVMHDDGTFADYSHLKHRGVNVQLGQNVRMGQLIGYSGATGFATGPHLHFVVKKAKRGGGFISIPVRFATRKGIMELQAGETYIGY
jgi:murein DD-endopeptidase MepM/ murein hydrolase activator NlpD